MVQPKVSVIIPVYNAQAYLCDCLDSIVRQTLRDIEIICIDDGSTDNSLAILEQYAAQDSRFRILRQENQGAGAARNHGLQYARGIFLSILDCDDFFEPDMLERGYWAGISGNADIVVLGCDYYDDQSQAFSPCDYGINKSILPSKAVFSPRDVKRDVFKLFVGWSWDKLFRRSFVLRHQLQFQEQRTSNDLLFVFGALVLADRITVDSQICAHHRRCGGSLSVTREKSWMCFHYALTALREQMQKNGLYDRFEQDFKNYYVHFSLWNLETLKEPAYTLLYNKLREEWFEEMGLLSHPRKYYYNRNEYLKFWAVYHYQQNQLLKKKHSFGGRLYCGIQCIKDHGFFYTFKHCIKRINYLF